LPGGHESEFDLWRDVFVQQKLPWGRFLQSALLHATAVALIYAISLSWIRQQKILAPATFDRSSLVTYSPEEYLPPLDTGTSEAPKAQTGDPVYAKQPILSVPPEADNRSQTIVVPPDLKLDRDVALPNIVATGAIVPAVPLDATQAPLTRMAAPETQVVAPAPDVEFAQDRVVRTAMKSDVIAPPPEVTPHHTRGVAGPETAVVEPPPELTQSTKGKVGLMNIGPSQVVAPAPQLTLAEQHSLAARGSGRLPGGGVQPVGPPPSVAAGNASAGGRSLFPEAIVGEHSPQLHRENQALREHPILRDRNRKRRARAGEPAPTALCRRACMWARRTPVRPRLSRGTTARRRMEIRTAMAKHARWLAVRHREPSPARALRRRFPTIKSPTWTARFLAASAPIR
jgi:hypothetical protein